MHVLTLSREHQLCVEIRETHARIQSKGKLRVNTRRYQMLTLSLMEREVNKCKTFSVHSKLDLILNTIENNKWLFPHLSTCAILGSWEKNKKKSCNYCPRTSNFYLFCGRFCGKEHEKIKDRFFSFIPMGKADRKTSYSLSVSSPDESERTNMDNKMGEFAFVTRKFFAPQKR